MGADRLERIDAILPVVPGRADDPEAPLRLPALVDLFALEVRRDADLDRARRLGQDVGEHEPPDHRRERGEARRRRRPSRPRPRRRARTSGDRTARRRRRRPSTAWARSSAAWRLSRGWRPWPRRRHGRGSPPPLRRSGRGGGRGLLGLLRPGLAQRLGQVLRIGHLLQRRQRPGAAAALAAAAAAGLAPAGFAAAGAAAAEAPPDRAAASFSFSVSGLPSDGAGDGTAGGLGLEVRLRRPPARRWRRGGLRDRPAGTAGRRPPASPSASAAARRRASGPRPRGPSGRPASPSASAAGPASRRASGHARPRGRRLRQRHGRQTAVVGRPPPARPAAADRTPRPARGSAGPLRPESRPPASPVHPAVRPPGCLSRSVVQPSVSSASRKTEVPRRRARSQALLDSE